MCVYETIYNNAIKKRDEAVKEIARCKEAISYFESWMSKVEKCYEILTDMNERNKVIASQCNEIILNGKPIDEGERHYPNGNGEKIIIDLVVVKGALTRLKIEIENQIEKLSESLEKSKKIRDNANSTIHTTPVPPCGKCSECNPPAVVVTSKTETQTQTSNEKKPPKTPRSKKRVPFNTGYEIAL